MVLVLLQIQITTINLDKSRQPEVAAIFEALQTIISVSEVGWKYRKNIPL